MRRLRSAVLALALSACLAPAAPQGERPDSHEGVPVVRVVDGDTIVVAASGSADAKVRLIGIDTPERDDCLYRASTDRMRALVEGMSVRLVRDVSETDRYGRLLRYVYAGATFVNALMIEEGYASAATYPPDVAHATEFIALERIARRAKRGLWAGACAA